MNPTLKILVGDVLSVAQCPNKNQAHKASEVGDLITAYVAAYVELVAIKDEEAWKKRKAN